MGRIVEWQINAAFDPDAPKNQEFKFGASGDEFSQ